MTHTEIFRPRVDTEHDARSAYRAMCHFDNATAELPLDPLLRELIRVRASMLNGCAYCIDMHTKDARAKGETEQRLYAVATWHEAPFFSPAERAAFAPDRRADAAGRQPAARRRRRGGRGAARGRRARRRHLDHRHDQRLEPRRDRVAPAGRRLRAGGVSAQPPR
jgi:AhpD family alkylhydroperoxidase